MTVVSAKPVLSSHAEKMAAAQEKREHDMAAMRRETEDVDALNAASTSRKRKVCLCKQGTEQQGPRHSYCVRVKICGAGSGAVRADRQQHILVGGYNVNYM